MLTGMATTNVLGPMWVGGLTLGQVHSKRCTVPPTHWMGIVDLPSSGGQIQGPEPGRKQRRQRVPTICLASSDAVETFHLTPCYPLTLSKSPERRVAHRCLVVSAFS